MNRQLRLGIILFLLIFGLTFTAGQITQATPRIACQGCMMDGDMMGGNRQDMGIVHQLFANHSRIRRTVKEIPGGVRTVTESDIPQITALIQAHVQSMHRRVDEGRRFAMMSRTLPIMFRNANRYERKFELTPKGIVVTKTSDDPNLVTVLREHSREVSGFVEGGKPWMGGGRRRWW